MRLPRGARRAAADLRRNKDPIADLEERARINRRLYGDLAKAYCDARRYDDARKAYRLGARLYGDPRFLLGEATTWFDEGKTEEGCRAMAQVLSKYPDYPPAREYLAQMRKDYMARDKQVEWASLCLRVAEGLDEAKGASYVQDALQVMAAVEKAGRPAGAEAGDGAAQGKPKVAWRLRQPGDMAQGMMMRASEEAPLPDGVPAVTRREDMPLLAARHEPFRNWLIGIVKDEEERPWWRSEALGVLWAMQDDKVVLGCLKTLQTWLAAVPEGQSKDPAFLKRLADLLPYRALMTTDPGEECLGIVRGRYGDTWPTVLRGLAGQPGQDTAQVLSDEERVAHGARRLLGKFGRADEQR